MLLFLKILKFILNVVTYSYAIGNWEVPGRFVTVITDHVQFRIISLYGFILSLIVLMTVSYPVSRGCITCAR